LLGKGYAAKTVWPMPISQHVFEAKGSRRRARNKDGIEETLSI